MKLLCFAIWDEKAKAYLPPFFLPAVGVAVRAFSDCVNDPGHAFGRNPHDYTLFQLSAWDDQSGCFGDTNVESICNGPSVIKRGEA